MVRKIVDVKDPILRRKSKHVDKIDKKVKELVKDLQDTLAIQKDPEGVGLAAPQIGKNLQIFVIAYKNLERVVINPRVLSTSAKGKVHSTKSKNKKSKKILEGCLSLPNYYGPIRRTNKVKLEYEGLDGKKQTEEFEGFNAQIIMHEMDHLNGVLFIDRILEQKAPLYKFKGEEWEEVELM